MKLNIRLPLRLYFILYVFAIQSLALAAATFITYLLNRFVSASINIPAIVWILLFSVVLGTAVTAFFSKWILSPITRLGSAMNRVAAGDFRIRLETGSRIRAVRDIFADFNVMARELGATEMLQSDFVSSVSHEIRTPVNAIEGYATLLQDASLSHEEREEYTDKILFNTRRLSELVGNILLLSKVENQSIPVETARYRLDEQVRRCILALEPKWTAKRVEFDVDMEPVLYNGNESLMQHVWINLIDNAVKFTPLGSSVRIRLREEAGRLLFSIEDSGPGISAEAQNHIYDKFYQADGSHKGDGNGLGLSLVKRILDSCHGEIAVQSPADCGSRFTVTLPAP